MSTGEIVSVDQGKVVIALRNLQLNLQRREELYAEMGAAMLVSIRRTFREQGSPSGSWVPLAAATVKRDPKKYGAGHKLLIDSGYMLNSITYQAFSGGVMIGTHVKYAAVQNFGSRDRTGGPSSPQARLADRAVKVKGSFRTIKLAPRYERVEHTRADGSKVMVPRAVFKETVKVKGKDGHFRTVTRNIRGPKYTKTFRVAPHAAYQNIPARPFMVFRPEDPGRLRSLAVTFANRSKGDAGLAGA